MTETTVAPRTVADYTTPRIKGEAPEIAASLRELIREFAGEGDNGRIAPEVENALEEAGLFHLTVPARYGGAEVTTRTLVETLIELSRADGSTAWSAMLINIGNWFATSWPVKVQDEIWGQTPNAKHIAVINPVTKAEATENGYRMSGKWAFSSGSFTATHALLGFLAPQADGGYRHAMAILDPGDWHIEKSWNPLGLRGTGSDTAVVENVEFPHERVVFFDDMVEGRTPVETKDTEVQARAAFLPKGTIIFGAIQVGLGKAAADYALDRMRNKGVTGTKYTQARNSPVHQLAAADASTKIDLAEMLALRAADQIDRAAEAGEQMAELDRARVRNDTGAIVTLIGDAVNQLLKGAGSGSYLNTNPMSRILRDQQTGGSHAHATPEVGKEVYGRLLLGADGGVSVDV